LAGYASGTWARAASSVVTLGDGARSFEIVDGAAGATIVAIDLGRGEVAWRVPFGDTPSVRSHPLLQGVALPPRLGVAGAPGVLVTKGGVVLGGGGDSALYAFDAATGKELARFDLPRRASATPMTYRARSGRQFVVMATGGGTNASLVAWVLK
jgi:quinoprotein glucose dehydrogenase